MSSRFPRLSDRGSTSQQERRRPPAGEEFTPPQERSDPRTAEDETRASLGQRLRSKWTTILALSLLGIIAAILAIHYGTEYFATIVNNTYVQAAVAVAGIFGAGHYTGFSRGQESVAGLDELVLHNPETDEVLPFKGTFDTNTDGEYPVFRPVKGLPGIIRSPDYYDADELLSSLPSDMDAKLRPHPGATGITMTDWGGRKATQTFDGLKPDGGGGESNIEVTVPKQAPEKTMFRLKQELEKAEDEIGVLEDQNTRLQRQLKDAYDTLSQSRTETIREIEEIGGMFLAFARRDGRFGSESEEAVENGADIDAMTAELRDEEAYDGA